MIMIVVMALEDQRCALLKKLNKKTKRKGKEINDTLSTLPEKSKKYISVPLFKLISPFISRAPHRVWAVSPLLVSSTALQ